MGLQQVGSGEIACPKNAKVLKFNQMWKLQKNCPVQSLKPECYL